MKRIIVCCDGTWNKPGSKDCGKIVETNVQNLYEAISKGTDEVKPVKILTIETRCIVSTPKYFL